MSSNEDPQAQSSGSSQWSGIEAKLNLCYFGHHPDWKEDLSTTDINVLASLLSQMLRYDPSTRVPPSTLLKHPWFTVERPTKEVEPSTQGEESSGVKEVSIIESLQPEDDILEEMQQGVENSSHDVDGIRKPQEPYDSEPDKIKESKPIDKVPDQTESIPHEPLQASNIESSRVGISKAEESEHSEADLVSEESGNSSDDTQIQEASEGTPRGWMIPSWTRWMRIGFQRLSKMIR